jgi:hypothetical protein
VDFYGVHVVLLQASETDTDAATTGIDSETNRACGARSDVSAEEQHRAAEASRRLDGSANAAGPGTYSCRSVSVRFIEQRLLID